jgi:hypothetical protein
MLEIFLWIMLGIVVGAAAMYIGVAVAISRAFRR